MRATLNIPDDLLSEVQKMTREKSKTKAITAVMREYVRQKKMKQLIALRGKIQVEYDWEKEEKLEMDAQKKRGKLIERKG